MGRTSKIKLPLSEKGKTKFTKIQVAVFNLEACIKLWFNDEPAPAVLVLAHSAYEIIRQINDGLPNPQRGMHDPDPLLFRDTPLARAYLAQWPAIFREAYNFCKHGGSDPMEVKAVDTKSNYLVIAGAIQLYSGLGFGRRQVFSAFTTWTQFTTPDLFTPVKVCTAAERELVKSAVLMGKLAFFDAYMKGNNPGLDRAGATVVKIEAASPAI